MAYPLELSTPRLRLRIWTDADRDDLAQMMADPEVMHDYGGPISRIDYTAGFIRDGYSRWLIETTDGPVPNFVGYAGVAAHTEPEHPLGPHSDIGWRLIRQAWSHGYATEAANAALEDVFSRIGLSEVVSYTSAANTRSRAVMKRLGLMRDGERDFTVRYPAIGEWRGLVWSGVADDFAGPRPGPDLSSVHEVRSVRPELRHLR